MTLLTAGRFLSKLYPIMRYTVSRNPYSSGSGPSPDGGIRRSTVYGIITGAGRLCEALCCQCTG